jgi:hypothetical protein
MRKQNPLNLYDIAWSRLLHQIAPHLNDKIFWNLALLQLIRSLLYFQFLVADKFRVAWQKYQFPTHIILYAYF